MPKINIPQSSRQLNTQASSVERSTQIAGASGQQIAQVGGVAEDISFKFAQKMQEADRLRQVTDAELYANQKINSLKLQALQDPDTDNLESKYSKEFSSIQQQAASMIKDKTAQIQFNGRYGLATQNAVYDLKKTVYKRKIDAGVNSMNNYVTESLNMYQRTGDSSNVEMAKAKIGESFKAGFISEKEKAKALKNISKSAIFSRFSFDPDNTIKNLDAAVGESSELTPDERSDLKIKLTKLKKEKDRDFKVTQSKVSIDLVSGILSGDVAEADLDKMVQSGVINSKFASAASEAIYNPDSWDDSMKTSPAGDYYIRSIDSLEGGEKEDVYSFVSQAVNDYNEKKINRNDLAFAMKAASEKINGRDDFLSKIKAAVSIYGQKAKEIAKFSFENGGDPRGYAAQLLKDKIKNQNPKLNMKDYIPESISDSLGIVKKVWDSFLDEYVDDEKTK